MSAAKTEAKERDDWECRFCGMGNEGHKHEYGEAIHAHHIVKKSDDGKDDPRNYITVCRDCHNTLEKTQANALSRIRDEHTTDLRERIKELEGENAELQEQGKHPPRSSETARLIERVHYLERQRRDPEWYKALFHSSKISAEIIGRNFGRKVRVETDSEKAIEEYQDWGAFIKRTKVSVCDSDIGRWCEEMGETISSAERFRYSEDG